MKNLTLLLLISVFSLSSCKKFLEEDTPSIGTSGEFYKTTKGLEYLVTSAYVSNKLWYAKEEGYDLSEGGTDTYTYGQQSSTISFLTYNQVNSFNGRVAILWVELYKGINSCNEALFHLSNPDHPLLPAQKQKRKGEVLFLRAHYYWLLTEIWGKVALRTEHTTSPVTSDVRNEVREVYGQITADLVQSYNLLKDNDNTSDADFGRITRDAVRAFKARIYATMASYVTYAGNPWNFNIDANAYYDSARFYADYFVNQNKLVSDYEQLWKFENNTSGRNPEGIFAINYSRGIYSQLNVNLNEYSGYIPGGQRPFNEREGGHSGHLMFGTQYDFGNSGMVRDLANGRPFRRFAPTKYLIDSYREDLDQRFDGQFKTVWFANANSLPTWSNAAKVPAGFTPSTGSLSDPIFRRGDTAIVITKKDLPDNRIVPSVTVNATTKVVSELKDRFIYLDGPYYVWDYNIMFDVKTGTYDVTKSNNHNWFIPLKKFDDPYRLAADGTGSENGARDAYLFRHAEMYLIAAEAAVARGGDGYSYLLKLADKRAKNGNGTELLKEYGIESGQITKEKLLDERAREFPGEQLRWFDLKRFYSPADWVARLKVNNPDVKDFINANHYVRPIPQIQLDAVTNSAEFGQNLGY